ncbi:hypothetical protein FPOAC1_012087 [Fusarium poae]|uniref:hypothetical protein n=1 Tax=Fusarium poae TaxID=36050 RepID=UPI001CE9FF44|nr:hypothetical protein FPOAC1_012087 [Fusarium poae]KAG8667261.1 hypothetical protein FPOAC1_012087 [Fusarium poae]
MRSMHEMANLMLCFRAHSIVLPSNLSHLPADSHPIEKTIYIARRSTTVGALHACMHASRLPKPDLLFFSYFFLSLGKKHHMSIVMCIRRSRQYLRFVIGRQTDTR